VDKLFRKALAEYDDVAWKSHIQFYIVDKSKDADMVAQWEETTNSPETAKKIIKMFNKKYGK